MSKKRNPPAQYDEDEAFEASGDDWAEAIDDTGLQPSSAESQARDGRRRDWRDAERYREERELRRQLEEAAWFEELASGLNRTANQ